MRLPTEIAHRVLTLRALPAFKGAGFLLPRVFAVVAIGIAVIPMINRVASTVFVLRGSGAASIIVADELATLARGWLSLAMLGHDVLAFLGLS